MAAPKWMREADRAFFGSKKPWSVQKDLILSNYIPPYLNHMLKRHRGGALDKPVLFADLFAGKGAFDDGSEGSPLIIVRAAEESAPGRWSAVFGNQNEEMHAALEVALKNYPTAHTRNTPAEALLPMIHRYVQDRSLFVFIDPYGLSGYDFELLVPLINRVNDGLSTELLINFMVSDFHKKSARDIVRKRGFASLKANTRSKIDNLDRTLGGDWWREFQYEDDLSTEQRSRLVTQGYIEKLKTEGLAYAGHCPVRERDEASPNYRVIHASPNIAALKLMNETMGNATARELHKRSVQEKAPLFADQVGDAEFQSWERGRSQAIADLLSLVPQLVSRSPGENRERLWETIVQDHFLQFFRKEYISVVKQLHDAGTLILKTPHGQIVEPGQRKGRNDAALLYFA